MPALHPLCTDHAVVSASRPRILGFATPGADVTVQLAGVRASAQADAQGRWRVDLPPAAPGGPHRLVARDATGEAAAQDVWLGEVWFGSGQSNMEWTLSQTKDSAPDIAAADEPRLRFFTVARAQTTCTAPETVNGRWQVCRPEEAGSFGAVAYFFGRRLIASLGRPVGMVVSAWGGSSIAPWLPEHALQSRPEYAAFRTELENAKGRKPDPQAYAQHEDPGVAAHARNWADPKLDDSAWKPLPVPGEWQNHGWAFNGAVWYRREVVIPEAWLGRPLRLELGIVDDCDQTFVNGVRVGGIGTETSNWWSTRRSYLVPASAVSQTRLLIAVRVFDLWGQGGILGYPSLRPDDAAPAAALRLDGPWRARSELELPLRSPGGPPLAPTALWNGMVHPLRGLGLDGVLWYQGESDVTRAALYPRLLADLIASWRRAFDAPDLPFGIVQLANFQARQDDPAESPWAELREAQRQVALHTPACGLALAIDAGEADDIHPRYKRTVGERLAAWALRRVHGHAGIADSGPLPVEAWREADGLRVRFTHAEGLHVRGDKLAEIALCGPDRSWVWADEARVEGDTVFARSAAIPAPTAIRYAWQSNPATTLENAAGLPASPFDLRAGL